MDIEPEAKTNQSDTTPPTPTLGDEIEKLITRITEVGGLEDLHDTAIDLRYEYLTLHTKVAALHDKLDYRLLF